MSDNKESKKENDGSSPSQTPPTPPRGRVITEGRDNNPKKPVIPITRKK